MIPARPLDRFPIIRTRSVEQMRAALARVYVRPLLELKNRVSALDVLFNNFQFQHVGLSYIKYGAAIHLGFSETNFFSQRFPIHGKGEIIIGKNSAILTSDNSATISSNVSYKTNYDADYEHLVMRLDSKALTKKLAAITGQPIGKDLAMNPVPDLARPEAQSLRNIFAFLVGEISNAATLLPPLMLAEMEQALMVAFLCGNQHNYSHLLEQPPPSVAPWQVRRAEDYIAANWDQPIRLEDIVTATGVSARSLFRTFRQNRGCSPMAFVKQVRLRHAQQLLQSAQTTTTVTRVAFACGFDDLGRFSKDYLRAFGELPSAALHRGKGAASSQH